MLLVGCRTMYRLLIASKEDGIAEALRGRLSGDFQIESCGAAEWALALIHTFKPDVIFVDTNLPDMDAFTLIRGIRASGERAGIVLLTSLVNELVMSKISALCVEGLLVKPCSIQEMASCIQEVSVWMQNKENACFAPENLLDTILMDLGFCVGLDRCRTIKQAVLIKYFGPCGMLMKQLYLEIAKQGNYEQVEKAIRDAIGSARKNGAPGLWNLYFHNQKRGKRLVPTNEEFISRLAECLRRCERLREPYACNDRRSG